jgi:hypothetical protein
MRRTLLAASLPAFAVTVSWLRLEEPRLATEAIAMTSLAVAPALLSRPWLRFAATCAAIAGAAWFAFGAQPWELLPGRDEAVAAPVGDAVQRGVGDFYSVVLPFVPDRHPEMHALLLVAVFGFVAGIALLVAARRPAPAAALTVAAVGWPATLLHEGAVAIGALSLAAALSIFLALRAQSARALLGGGAVAALVVAGAVWAASATTFARESVLEWELWDFRGLPAKALGVRFVWDANYDGISFPRTETVVLEIEGTERAHYWRASTLDVFTADRWFEEPFPFKVGDPNGTVPVDPLTPPRARDTTRWLEQRVEVKALVDDRLVAAGTPTALEAGSLGTVFYMSGGVIRARRAIDGGTHYRVWSYVPDPSPAALAAAPARYPSAARRFLTVWGAAVPQFGASRREERMNALLDETTHRAVAEYRPLYDEARRITAGATTPYAAVLALESWFRRSGGFRYEERPPVSDLPPLVYFVTSSRAGYCQHFAGAMAVMARLLGIPARVAVGFTSGRYVDGAWKVTDHNAHAWVEVWFPRHGWVAFDPTPGRGRFAGIYSFASESAEAVAALGRGELGGAGRTSGRGTTDGTFEIPGSSKGSERPSILALALVLLVGGVAAVGVLKWSVRRARYLTVDPRRTAAASRRELEGFLRDQGIGIPASATLEGLRQAVASELGLDGSAFVEAAGRGRFGPPREAPRAARGARQELRMLLGRARGELSVWARLRGFASLRSLRSWQG